MTTDERLDNIEARLSHLEHASAALLQQQDLLDSLAFESGRRVETTSQKARREALTVEDDGA